jgi:hypothetical protein
MPAIRRLSDTPYRWDIIEAPLSEVANQEKLAPADFISALDLVFDGLSLAAPTDWIANPMLCARRFSLKTAALDAAGILVRPGAYCKR